MYTQRLLSSFMILGVVAICSLQLFGAPEIRKEYQGKMHPKELMPAVYIKLFDFPSSDLQKLGNVDIASANVVSPREESIRWIHEVVDPSWLPDKELSFVFIRNEINDIDVVRCQWEKNRTIFQVAQTASLFTLKITPALNPGMGKRGNELIETSRQMCVDVFKRSGKRRTSQGEIVPIKDLSKKISSYLFSDGIIFEWSGQGSEFLLGRGKTAEEEGVKYVEDEEKFMDLDRPENPDWDKSRMAWNYWFRMVSWWNDGKSLGFYFPKNEDQDPLDFSRRNIDHKWFDSSSKSIEKKHPLKKLNVLPQNGQ